MFKLFQKAILFLPLFVVASLIYGQAPVKASSLLDSIQLYYTSLAEQDYATHFALSHTHFEAADAHKLQEEKYAVLRSQNCLPTTSVTKIDEVGQMLTIGNFNYKRLKVIATETIVPTEEQSNYGKALEEINHDLKRYRKPNAFKLDKYSKNFVAKGRVVIALVRHKDQTKWRILPYYYRTIEDVLHLESFEVFLTLEKVYCKGFPRGAEKVEDIGRIVFDAIKSKNFEAIYCELGVTYNFMMGDDNVDVDSVDKAVLLGSLGYRRVLIVEGSKSIWRSFYKKDVEFMRSFEPIQTLENGDQICNVLVKYTKNDQVNYFEVECYKTGANWAIAHKINHVSAFKRSGSATSLAIVRKIDAGEKVDVKAISLAYPPPQPVQIRNRTAPKVAVKKVLEGDIVEADDSMDEEVDDIVYDEMNELEEESVAVEVFVILEEMPKYPGGEDAMWKFIADEMKYPKAAIEANVQGKVYVEFVVNKDGGITNVKVLRGIGHGCDEEAVQIIESMPNWIPGENRGKPVNATYRLPIKFAL